MSFTDAQPWVVTERDITLDWNARGRHGLACGLCLHEFDVGETARWFYCPARAPNTFVCVKCDGADVVERWVQFWQEVVRPILRRWGEND